jgi:hypothetical protein
MRSEVRPIFVTEDALSKPILRAFGRIDDQGYALLTDEAGTRKRGHLVYPSNWHPTRAAAVACVEDLRRNEIHRLRLEIAALENMKIRVEPE